MRTWSRACTNIKNAARLEFHFFSGTGVHSVVSSTFENPCVPVTNGFFSGYVTGSLTGVRLSPDAKLHSLTKQGNDLRC
jgi:hypothetical protein